MSDSVSTSESSAAPLSKREREVLRLVVRNFVDTAGPVGSRSLVRRFNMDLSPASIRNTMSDLEEKGYLDHPYTSAGRVPTERGYRTFVDELMEPASLPEDEHRTLEQQILQVLGDFEELFKESSRMLGRLTNLLGIVLSPRLSTAVLERLDIVPLSAKRLMFVLSVREGLVKTIVLECEAEVNRRDIEDVVRIINERIAGLTLREIRDTYRERVHDLDVESQELVQLTVEESGVLFSEPTEGRLRYGGTKNILDQPEFQEVDDLRHLISVIEDEDLLVKILEQRDAGQNKKPDSDLFNRVLISIGSEHGNEQASRYSIVTSEYRLGGAVGTLGVIGPTRMDYPRVAALVENMALLLSHKHVSR